MIEEAFLGSPSSDGYGRVDLRVDIKGIGKGIYYHQLVGFCLQSVYEEYNDFKEYLDSNDLDMDHGEFGFHDEMAMSWRCVGDEMAMNWR